MTSEQSPCPATFQARVEQALAKSDPADVLHGLLALADDPAARPTSAEDGLRMLVAAGMDVVSRVANDGSRGSADLVRELVAMADLCVDAGRPELNASAVLFGDTASDMLARLASDAALSDTAETFFRSRLVELYGRLGRPDRVATQEQELRRLYTASRDTPTRGLPAKKAAKRDTRGGDAEPAETPEELLEPEPCPKGLVEDTALNLKSAPPPDEPLLERGSGDAADDDLVISLDTTVEAVPEEFSPDKSRSDPALREDAQKGQDSAWLKGAGPGHTPMRGDDEDSPDRSAGHPPEPVLDFDLPKACGSAGPAFSPVAAFGRAPGILGRMFRKLRGTNRAGSGMEDNVNCGIFAPPVAAVGDVVFVQAFAFLPEHADEAARMAREFDEDARRRGVKTLDVRVPRESRLLFHLVVPGMEVDDPVQSLTWRGDTQSVQFCVTVPDDMRTGAVIGSLTVCLQSVPVGCIKFKIDVAPKDAPGVSLADEIPAGIAAPRYRQAFVSYASPDRAEVLKRVQMLAGVGIRYFQDVLDLEPGEAWERTIRKRISECDLFLLFWSSAARQSEWVHKEVEAALARKAGNDLNAPDIVPVIIEGPPVVEPPPALAHLHFNDRILYFIS